jgi:hypothetical protein
MVQLRCGGLREVVCFGPEQKMMHKHVASARDAGRLTDSGKFRLEWYDRPRPGMLERLSLITYVPSHGGEWFGGTSGFWVHPVGGSFEEFGTVGGKAVVLDACDTASGRWLYDRGSLRAECRSLKNKPLLGGSGNARPSEVHGRKILEVLPVRHTGRPASCARPARHGAVSPHQRRGPEATSHSRPLAACGRARPAGARAAILLRRARNSRSSGRKYTWRVPRMDPGVRGGAYGHHVR